MEDNVFEGFTKYQINLIKFTLESSIKRMKDGRSKKIPITNFCDLEIIVRKLNVLLALWPSNNL
jgi:hypothetical protein